MIVGFRHKGLKLLYEQGSVRGVPPIMADKLERILTLLDVAASPKDMDVIGFRLHQLKGQLGGFWSVRVTGNWRVIFRFDGDNVSDVDLVDYH